MWLSSFLSTRYSDDSTAKSISGEDIVCNMSRDLKDVMSYDSVGIRGSGKP